MLNSKVIWITGASSGLGEEMAYQLSREGAWLILSARREDALERVRQHCHNPNQHHILPLDLTAIDDHQHSVEKALGFFGRIDILINNGGVSQRSLCIDTPQAIERALFEVDFFGTTALTKTLLPHMIAHKSGQIVNIASVAGKVGPPLRTSYAAAKHALLGYMDSLRCEVDQHGISVTNICPGFVKTNVSINALNADGSAFGKIDHEIANGMAVDVCVQRIVRAIANKEKEVVIAQGIAKVAYHLRRLFPNTFLAIFQRTANKLLKET